MKRYIYLISPQKISQPKFYEDLSNVLKTKKVKYFQLRIKKISNLNLIKISNKIKKIVKKNNVKFIINDIPAIAKKIGADYFLLIQSIFDNGMINDIDGLIEHGHNLGLKVLIEAHTKQEFENSCNTNADIIGINNRNLDTLEIDLNTTKKILENTETTKLVISESGISTSSDIQFLHKSGGDGYLVGSSIMKSNDIQQTVQNLVNAI